MFLPKPKDTPVVLLVLLFLFLSTSHLSSQNNGSEIQRVRIRFTSNGFVRPLLLGFTPNNTATDGVDYGYDALFMDAYPNDMFWMIEGERYVIQGVGEFNNTRQLPLGVFIANAGPVSISLTALENFDTDIDVYIYDSLLNTVTQINTTDYQVTLDANTYTNRFYLAFASDATLSLEDQSTQSLFVNYLNASDEIYIKMPEITSVEKVHLINILGQSIHTWQKTDFDKYNLDELRIPMRNVSKGNYVVHVETNTTSINKQIVIR